MLIYSSRPALQRALRKGRNARSKAWARAFTLAWTALAPTRRKRRARQAIMPGLGGAVGA